MTKPRSKPFERFGSHVLFKKIDSDALGELWRVGAIDGKQIGTLLALRKLTGNTAAFAGAVSAASPLVGNVEGAALVRHQSYGVINGEPFITWEYGGGRSLRHIVDRAREGGHVPIPTDQALAIGEKIAAALEYVSSVKVDGKRILHGSLVPQFVWVYEDGDVRVAGQYLNSGLLASLSNADVAKEIGPYVAPELRNGGTPTRATDVYAVGAILFLVVTGQEPPDSAADGLAAALSSARLMPSGEPLPAEIRAILETAMNRDPAARYSTADDLKQAISEVLSAGNYAPTTFNLAFYLHNLLRKEMEGEAVEREKESKVNPEPYLEEIEEEKAEVARPRAAAPPPRPVTPAAAPAPTPAPTAPEPPTPGPLSSPALSGSSDQLGGKSKMPLIAAAVFVIAGGAAGVWYVTKGKSEPPAEVAQAQPATPVTQTEPEPAEEPPLEEPVVTEIPGAEEAAPATDAEAERKKAMEAEVNRRVQEEMRKLQEEYNRELKQKQTATAPTAPPQAATPKPPPAEPAATMPDKPAAPDVEKTAAAQAATGQPEATETEPATQAAPAPPPPAAPAAVKEGDLVVSNEVDSLPTIIRRADPTYPPIAAKQKIGALVIVSALVDEKGKVIDAKVLRGDSRNLGFDDASLRAIRRFTFQPATKDGKKVKTWHSVPFIFGKGQ